MVLIVTNKNDPHADSVIRVLNSRGEPVFRLNTEDLLTACSFDFGLGCEGWNGQMNNSGDHSFLFGGLSRAWLRKPIFEFNLPIEGVGDGERKFVQSECKSLIETIYSVPNIEWVNDPFQAQRSKVKFQQLILAKSLGFSVPKTIITNSSDQATPFINSCKSGAVVKSIYTSNIQVEGVNQGVLTKKVSVSDVEELSDTFCLCPVLLQEYCEKEFELRVVVLGDKVFAVKIDSQKHSETSVDWRVDTYLSPHEEFCLPDDIAYACVEFLRRQGLLYGAIDIIKSVSGDYVFLENNPFGQFLWLEDLVGIPLSEEFADFLTARSS